MKYLVDTDWIIDHLKGKNDNVKKKLKEFRSSGIAVSIISLAELYEGIHGSRNPEQTQNELENLLSQFSILGIDQEICKIFGKQRTKLRTKGQIIDNFDLLIASTAIHNKLTILSNNRKHFERIRRVKYYFYLVLTMKKEKSNDRKQAHNIYK